MKTPEEILNSKVYFINRLKEMIDIEFAIKQGYNAIFLAPIYESIYDKYILPHELNQKVSEFILTILPIEYEKIYDKFVELNKKTVEVEKTEDSIYTLTEFMNCETPDGTYIIWCQQFQKSFITIFSEKNGFDNWPDEFEEINIDNIFLKKLY